MNVARDLQHLYRENYKTLSRDIEEKLIKWEVYYVHELKGSKM